MGSRVFDAAATPVALVTGGSQGIGAACVRAFAAKGWKVAVLALPSPELDQVAAPGVLTIAGDVTSAAARETAVERTIATYGSLDILVNSAGVGLYAAPSEVPLELVPRLFDINVFAPLAMAQLVVPFMRRKGSGTIVNISSVSSTVPMPWAAAYCASKAALDSIHNSLRRELAGSRIHLVRVCPGVVDTHFRDHVLTGEAPERVRNIRLAASPGTVAGKVVKAIERRQRTVYVPWVARPFVLLEALAPQLMDWYLRRFTPPGAGKDTLRKKAVSGL